MLTRRRLLKLVPPSLMAVAAGGCASNAEPTPGDDSATGDDTAPGEDPPASCEPTDDDIEGPFYRSNAPERDDLAVDGDEGVPLNLSGRVFGADGCTPIAGAVVDLWHADPDGAYDNDSAAMKYRGRVTTDANGRWAFQTLEPGRYLNGAQYRPAHLHIKIWVGGVEKLTTQLYFPGDPFNATDNWYNPALEVVRTGVDSASFDFVV